MSTSTEMNRRTCLKGLGVSLALPFMEAMGWADTAKGKTDKPPVRLGFMYMPHGVIMNQFWPENAKVFSPRHRRRSHRCVRCSINV